MSVKQILINAKALIDTPDKWTQDEFARTSTGEGVSSHSPGAICFCSLGALNRLRVADPTLVTKPAKDHLRSVMGKPIAYFNDEHSHAEVMAAWDLAVETAPN